ncbi:MAG TPA: cytochrome d ubiquinol oxidase subunit II [Rhodospirillaceae bacterium]|jgi:cytochrome d ubiquinol oxidase subunit II|nr:cytochrome d ubiquinol oxidase subunit II [Alphaproteobacteria bacterium]HBH27068.1 cytochrome d ubiquinol oxidase subunit II [Rhodospirillaceae bacterium]
MFTFENVLDLPLIWGGLIGTAVLLYVLLDGFDLGVGILFPFAPSEKCQDKMMNSIAPFWDANETWLVLGGGGLFAAFPLAYAIVMPALYIPVMAMLLALIFRGVAFEFRFKARARGRFWWGQAFHFGSLLAAFFQGAILGGITQGFVVQGRVFAGGAFDWLTAFSMVTGLGVVAGYALLGATWTVMKNEGLTQSWARGAAEYALIIVAAVWGIVSLWVPTLHPHLLNRWMSEPNIYYLAVLPCLMLLVIFAASRSLIRGEQYWPFVWSSAIFLLGFVGIGVSLWPWVVPYTIPLAGAAAAGTSLSLMLVGAALMLPVILAYTAFCHYTFRGKVGAEPMY